MQYNIFNNDFYEDMPGVPWAYRIDVFIGDPPQAITKLAKAVKEIDIPDAELETMDAFHAGLVFKIPTRYKNSNSFGAIFNDDKNLSVYKELLKLFRRSYDNREQTIQSAIQNRVINNRYDNNFQRIGTGTYSGREITRKYANQKEELMLNVYIIDPRKLNYKDTKLDLGLNNVNEEVINGLKANDPEIVAVYTFRDCFVENIETVEFDYSSEECVEWPIKIHFNEMSVDYPHQDKILIPEEDFKMEELTIPQFDKNDDASFSEVSTKHNTEADVADELAHTLAENQKYFAEMEQAVDGKQGNERNKAVLKSNKDANSEGMVNGANFNTEANLTKAMQEEINSGQEIIDEKNNVSEIRAAGITSFGTGTEQQVAQQAFPILSNVIANEDPTGYGFGDPMAAAQGALNIGTASEAHKEESRKNVEAVQHAFYGSTMDQMQHSDLVTSSVENPKNNQALSYYDENRNTVEKNANDQNVTGGLIEIVQKEARAIERERLENNANYGIAARLKEENQQKRSEMADKYQEKHNELTQRAELNRQRAEKLLKENPEQAEIIKKYLNK